MNQYILLLTNSGIGLPTDLWVPATDKIKPMESTQYAVGGVYSVTPQIDITIEGFYKEMNNLIEYKEGASFFDSNTDWQDKVESGKGWAYGGEFLLESFNYDAQPGQFPTVSYTFKRQEAAIL